MAYDVSGLSNYTKENETLLVMKSIFGSKTSRLIQAEGNVMTGVKSSEKINIGETDAIFQDGGTCGFTSSGNTGFTQREVQVGKVKVNEALCPKDLESKYTQKALKIGKNESIPYEVEYTDQKAGRIAENVEKAMWQGDKASGDVNLNKWDGLIKINDASGANINANQLIYTGVAPIAAGTGIIDSNVRKIVNGMWKALPAALKGKSDVRIFCGWDVFETFVASYVDANLFHFAPKGTEISDTDAGGEVLIPGTTYRLTAVHGLDVTNRLYALRMSNLFEATDLENEEEKFEIFWAKEAQQVRFIAEFKKGVNVAFPNEVVSFKLTA